MNPGNTVRIVPKSPRFSRPFGTQVCGAVEPNAEALGYCHMSLRDQKRRKVRAPGIVVALRGAGRIRNVAWTCLVSAGWGRFTFIAESRGVLAAPGDGRAPRGVLAAPGDGRAPNGRLAAPGDGRAPNAARLLGNGRSASVAPIGNRLCRRVGLGGVGIALLLTTTLTAAPLSKTNGPVKVELRQSGGRYQLFVDQKPFYIKGAGLEFGSQEKLAEHGGNSFRTWRTENGHASCQEVLDRAMRNGLYVTMGLDIARERHGFDYNDPAAVARQLAEVKAQVLKYKDHPALLIWAIGNELNLGANNPKVWDAVNEISKMIHQLDPNHLTTSPLAGISPELVQQLKTRAPDLDLLSVQMYADIVNLPKYLKQAGWTGPYMITEWGATGHWEVGKTAWGAPLENDSTTKAEFYKRRYETVIEADHTQCVGSYVFLWGQKQERTPTWYGMFLESGEETATVDVLHHFWSGSWPTNCSPRLEGAWLDGKTAAQNVRLKAGEAYAAKVRAADSDGDRLTYRWELLEESTDLKWGGDPENKPKCLPNLVGAATSSETFLKAPAKPGAYRLFVYVFDGHGHAAHANIPFYVDEAPKLAGQ